MEHLMAFSRPRKKDAEPTPLDAAASAAPPSEAALPAGGSPGHEELLTAVPLPDEPGKTAEPQKSLLPDPHWYKSISLGPDNDSPHIHLARSYRYKQMQVRFDEKPAKEITQQLHEAGWRWNSNERVWTIQIESGNQYAVVAAAEQLFRRLGNQIREQNGLPPVASLGTER
jgi:hypothetical protein